MSVLDTVATIKNIVAVILKVCTLADKAIDFIIQNVKGVA